MKHADAIELIRDAIGGRGGVWADLGAGTGTFTRALSAVLGAGSTVFAVDADARAVRALRELSTSTSGGARVITVKADFAQPLELPGLVHGPAQLDGMLLANALTSSATRNGCWPGWSSSCVLAAARSWWSTTGAKRAVGCPSRFRRRDGRGSHSRRASRSLRSRRRGRRRTREFFTPAWRRGLATSRDLAGKQVPSPTLGTYIHSSMTPHPFGRWSA